VVARGEAYVRSRWWAWSAGKCADRAAKNLNVRLLTSCHRAMALATRTLPSPPTALPTSPL
jgi:hypothetical protein